eukprot:103987-Rhodomonas_salina.2
MGYVPPCGLSISPPGLFPPGSTIRHVSTGESVASRSARVGSTAGTRDLAPALATPGERALRAAGEEEGREEERCWEEGREVCLGREVEPRVCERPGREPEGTDAPGTATPGRSIP